MHSGSTRPTLSSEGIFPPLPDPIPAGPEDSGAGPEGSDAGPEGSGDREWVIGPHRPWPPFPPFPPFRFRRVRCGCWLISYRPKHIGPIAYDGTLRVECHSAGRTASGDLYQRPIIYIPLPPWKPRPFPFPPPNPANGIPILSLGRYRYYLRVTQILEWFTFGNSFTLGFEMWRFAAPNSWTNEGAFEARMTWMPAPSGYPSTSDYLEGDVKNAAGTIVGRLRMGWLSPYYRKASVEIDSVAGIERPIDNGAGVTWQTVFDTVGWDVTTTLSDTDVAEASGDSWSDAEMHAAMLARRDPISLDTNWRYHILSVKLIDSTPRGIMYDAFGSDSNSVPREGVGIATNWVFDNSQDWGLCNGQRFGAATGPFFRTAVHELGHAFGLFHNTTDNFYMNTTDVIASSGTAANPFPNNIGWNYAEDDLKRLRHYPDIFVRPGGTAFGTASTATPPISPTDLQVEVPSLELRVGALLGEVPIGAPVRVTLDLVNVGEGTMEVPEKLSLKTDFVRGWVTDPSGTVRSFSPVVRCIEDQPMRELDAGEQVSDALTLLRGFDGALFPMPGLHRVTVEVRWDAEMLEAVVTGETTVLVTAATDEGHAAAAHRVLATPDAHLVLVLGGDHLEEGVDAVKVALDNPVLRPHFAYTEAKRLAQRFYDRGPKLKEAAALIDDDTVMSGAEVGKLARLAKTSGGRKRDSKLDEKIKAKAETVEMNSDARAAVDAL